REANVSHRAPLSWRALEAKSKTRNQKSPHSTTAARTPVPSNPSPSSPICALTNSISSTTSSALAPWKTSSNNYTWTSVPTFPSQPSIATAPISTSPINSRFPTTPNPPSISSATSTPPAPPSSMPPASRSSNNAPSNSPPPP